MKVQVRCNITRRVTDEDVYVIVVVIVSLVYTHV